MSDHSNPAQPKYIPSLQEHVNSFTHGMRNRCINDISLLMNGMKTLNPLITNERGFLNNPSSRTLEESMSNSTPEGAAHEGRILEATTLTYLDLRRDRDINEEFMEKFAEKLADLTKQQTVTGGVRADTKQLTIDEHAAQKDTLDFIRVIQSGIKGAFPMGSPQWTEFHIGEAFETSTPKLIAVAADIVSGYDKYQTPLTAKKIMPKDKANLVAASKALSAIDTLQERAKKNDSPQATSEGQKAMDEFFEMADLIYLAAGAEFKKRPKILKEFTEARKLRLAPTTKKPKPDPEPPATEN